MNITEKMTTKGVTAQKEETSVTKTSKVCGPLKSPRWRKVLVYYCKQQTVEVKGKDIIGQLGLSAILALS